MQPVLTSESSRKLLLAIEQAYSTGLEEYALFDAATIDVAVRAPPAVDHVVIKGDYLKTDVVGVVVSENLKEPDWVSQEPVVKWGCFSTQHTVGDKPCLFVLDLVPVGRVIDARTFVVKLNGKVLTKDKSEYTLVGNTVGVRNAKQGDLVNTTFHLLPEGQSIVVVEPKADGYIEVHDAVIPPDGGTLAFNLGALADAKLFLYDIEAEAGRMIPKPGNKIVDRATVKVDSVPLDDDEFYIDENYVILHNKFTTAKIIQIHFWIRKDNAND